MIPIARVKACTELVVSSFRNSFFNLGILRATSKGIASARAGNVIGGGDRSTDRIIPDIVRSLQEQKCIEVRNPDAIRPGNMCWTYLRIFITSWIAGRSTFKVFKCL
jgi:CDP-glucose 4,6-dehydratase